MGDRWSADQVVALAPDASSVAAGRRLASPSTWSGLGASPAGAVPAAVFGLCQGSGKNPYQAVVDLDGPAYRCTCPSRKFPCKHALGLLLLWSSGAVPDVDAPADFAAGWLESRVERATKREETAARRETGPVDPVAAARRAEERADRVAGGLAELRRWLEDQVRSGLAAAERAGYAPFERMAARMVDAQAPGVAGWLRRLPAVVASGPGWPDRLLAEYALLHLLVRAHDRLDDLPPPLAATVRRRVGYTVSREAVLAEPAVRDTWAVLASRDAEEDRLVTRRVWLRGTTTGRDAVVLSFATAGRPLDASLVPLTSVDADLHFHPDAAPLRAVVGERYGQPVALGPVAGGSVADALAAVAAVLAADPWTTSWPAVLDAAVLVPQDGGRGWTVTDGTGSLPVARGQDSWALVAQGGGRPVPLLVEWTPDGVRPLAVLPAGRPAVVAG